MIIDFLAGIPVLLLIVLLLNGGGGTDKPDDAPKTMGELYRQGNTPKMLHGDRK